MLRIAGFAAVGSSNLTSKAMPPAFVRPLLVRSGVAPPSSLPGGEISHEHAGGVEVEREAAAGVLI